MTDEVTNGVCPKCRSSELIFDPALGEEICSNCGLVIVDEIVNRGPEWRAFTATEKANRSRTGVGSSYSFYDRGLSTSFGGNRDGQGNRLNIKTKNKMKKLKKYDNRSKIDGTWSRNLSIAMTELDKLSTKLHIPRNVKEHAALIYRTALKHDLIRGRSIDAFVAASIYASCRLQKIPRTLKKVTNASTRSHSEIARTYRLLIRELSLKMPIDDPLKFIPSIAAKLNLRSETEHRAIEILRRAKELQELSGKDPRGVAAAALYMACIEKNDKRVQKEVAAASGTTEVTLRNRLKGLESVLETTTELDNQNIIVQSPINT